MEVQKLIIIMWHDLDMAFYTQKRPILDYEKYIPGRLEALWNMGPDLLPTTAIGMSEVHRAVTALNIRKALIRLRAFLSVSEKYISRATDMDIGSVRALLSWAFCISLYDAGVLWNYAIDMLEEASNNNLTCDDRNMASRLMEAAAALTVLHSIRKYMHEAEKGVDIRDTSHAIIPLLEGTLRKALSLLPCTAQTIDQSEIIFWMLFTGAHYEVKAWAKSAPFYELTPLAGWFGSHLAVQARSLDLMKWDDAIGLLQRFAFSDNLDYHPQFWYENLIGGYGTARQAR